MASNRVSNILMISGIGLLAYALYSYYMKQKALFENFTYTLEDAKITNFSVTNIEVSSIIRFKNQSAIEVTVNSIIVYCYVNGVNVAVVNNNVPFVIAANGSSDVPIILDFDPTIIVGNIITLMSDLSQLKNYEVKLTGAAAVKSSFISTSVPIDYTSTVGQMMA